VEPAVFTPQNDGSAGEAGQAETKKGCAQEGDARGLWNWVGRGQQRGRMDDAGYYREAWRLPLVSPGFVTLISRPGSWRQMARFRSENLKAPDQLPLRR